jgi:hypothetical protein
VKKIEYSENNYRYVVFAGAEEISLRMLKERNEYRK